ncbi:hypothetical protein [Aestuariivirga litoralis]|uniref:hypothetical protein n=1 Tax=Aestuariivirga litoralis TaxID=2650924 RepID=UPI0018C7FC7F|nr:hypothetical protein [Aestuariivirga litoralis]MBG1231092.1 hypothetical protein [Aestuariivirga litoralis]
MAHTPRLPAILRACALLFLFAVLSLGSQGSFTTSAQAQSVEQQCTVPQSSCGCASCGCSTDVGIPHCPDGYSPFDDVCLPDCPAGFIRYPGMPGLCLPPCHHGCGDGYDQVPLPSCPQGFVRDLRDPGLCIPDVDRTNHQGMCPDGMNWSYNTGRCEATCPSGFYPDERGLCQSYFARECPKDYTRDLATGKCVPPGVWPPDYDWVCLPTCPPGTLRDIQHPTMCVPPPPTCPQGFENREGRCLPVCEPGLQRDRYGYCVPPGCPQGTYPNLRGKCVPVQCPEGMRPTESGQCLPPPPPPSTCDQGSERFNGQCMPICDQGTSRNADGRCVPDRPTCPQGQRLNPDTNQCERPPGNNIPNCRQGQAYSPRLKACVDIPKVVHCDKGQYKNGDGRCVDIPQQPPPPKQRDCPQGMKSDGQGGCIRIIVPRSCPDGTFMNPRTHRCQPIRIPGNNDQPDDNDEQQPPIRINPNILQQLAPQRPQFKFQPQQQQQACPDGMKMDQNGRCRG